MRKFLTRSFVSAAVAAVLSLVLTPVFAQPLSQEGEQASLEIAQRRGLEFLKNEVAARSLSGAEDFQVKRVFLDEQGLAHLHVQQTINGVPVFGGEAIVHMNNNGDTFAFTNFLKDNVELYQSPSLSEKTAVELAVQDYGCKDCLTAEPTIDLWILRGGKTDHLAYRVQLRREDESHETALPVIFIDASTGETIWKYDNLQTATGSGSSLYSGTVSLTTYQSGSTYYLEDTGRRIGTFDYRNGTSSVYRFSDTDNVWNTASQRAGVDAHYGATKVWDYFYNTHGRNGIDGNGGPGGYTSANGSTRLISSRVHYSSNYNNAYWNGTYMTYGDGDGSTFSPLVTIDICGHEMTHGITERTAGLVYSNESGALNESFSDVFGAMVERYTEGENTSTWLIGEDAYTPATGGDALRYMDNPRRNNQPDHYSIRYTGTGDNGGVHINSAIANHAFYLLARGGTHRLGGSVTGIGADKAARIWYRALTSYMTSSTNFRGARTATINAANALYGSGSAESSAVAQTWSAVGVN